MIRYALVCDRKHQFDIWFADSNDYDKQRKRGLVACPLCDSRKVEKAIMAPRLSGTRKSKGHAAASERAAATEAPAADAQNQVAIMSPAEQEFRAKLKELRDHILKNADNVGKRFPEEARKMHYGEIAHRSIFGEASPEDAKALAEEGIEFHPIPFLPDERN